MSFINYWRPIPKHSCSGSCSGKLQLEKFEMLGRFEPEPTEPPPSQEDRWGPNGSYTIAQRAEEERLASLSSWEKRKVERRKALNTPQPGRKNHYHRGCCRGDNSTLRSRKVEAVPSRLEWREEIVDFDDFGEELMLISEMPARARRLLGGKGGRRRDRYDWWRQSDDCSIDELLAEELANEGNLKNDYDEWEDGDYEEEEPYWDDAYLEEEPWDEYEGF